MQHRTFTSNILVGMVHTGKRSGIGQFNEELIFWPSPHMSVRFSSCIMYHGTIAEGFSSLYLFTWESAWLRFLLSLGLFTEMCINSCPQCLQQLCMAFAFMWNMRGLSASDWIQLLLTPWELLCFLSLAHCFVFFFSPPLQVVYLFWPPLHTVKDSEELYVSWNYKWVYGPDNKSILKDRR